MIRSHTSDVPLSVNRLIPLQVQSLVVGLILQPPTLLFLRSPSQVPSLVVVNEKTKRLVYTPLGKGTYVRFPSVFREPYKDTSIINMGDV